MQELAGRLTALDPEASATLKVVSYFDTLVGHEAGVETLLRGAAVLSGCPAGLRPGPSGPALRVSSSGRPLAPGEPGDWPSSPAGPEAVVWLERAGASHANDAMILERLALAVAISRSRHRPSAGLNRAIELVLDAGIPERDRAAAAARLRLDPRRPVRAVARPAGGPIEPPRDREQPDRRRPNGIISTAFGLARAEIVPATAPVAARSGDPAAGRSAVAAGSGDPAAGRSGDPAASRAADLGLAGIGTAVEPGRLPQSWSAALVALRLADEHTPVVEADALGAVLLLAEAADAATRPHPDVAVLETIAADRSALATLDALAAEGTARAAAAVLGVHHSTVQSRVAAATTALGYDPRTPAGRTRYVLARTLHRLRHAAPL